MLSSTLYSENSSSALSCLALIQEHPLHTGLGVLGALAVFTLIKAARKSTAFRSLDGPPVSSFFRGEDRVSSPEPSFGGLTIPEGHQDLLFGFSTSLEIHEKLLNTYGAVCRVKGMFGEDQLWIADPRAMNDIILKAHDDFREPKSFISWIKLVMGPHIATTNGHKHKVQRKILNPVFTASHMRNLVTPTTPTITTIAHQLEDIVASKAQVDGNAIGTVDMYTLMSNVALEMIGQAGMGYSFGVMENKKLTLEYLDASRDIFPLMNSMWYIRPFLPLLMKTGPASFRRFVVDHIPMAPVQALKKATDAMDGMAIEIYEQKKQALASGTLDSEIAAGNDIMSQLLKQNQVLSPEEQMSEEEVLAQVNGFIFAGHDTTSGGLARTLHLLAQHPEVQTQLREEVQEAHRLYGKDLDYDQINSLSYLDAVCRESLRLHSPAQQVERVAQKDWILPLQYPVKSSDGRSMISSIHVKKGAHIYLSLGSANRDKQTWGDDADQFKPSRWLQSLPSSVTDAKVPGVYSSTMTFLGGPRACLGFKFSQLEMKIVLSNLISSFNFGLGGDEISWHSAGVVKPHVRRKDGTLDMTPCLPMKVTLIGDSN